MPSLKKTVLFIEDSSESGPATFDRDLQSLILLPEFQGVRGILIGRFQKESQMATPFLLKIIKTKRELSGIPVVSNADFGHTTPQFTFPVGGTVQLAARKNHVEIKIIKH